MQKENITIIGFPIDLGAGRRGVDMSPSALIASSIGQRIL